MFASIMAEKFGGKVGGYVSAFPAPAAIAYFFIAYGQSVEAAVQATVSFPVAYSLVGILLLAYALLAKRGLVLAMGVAIGIWLAASLAFIQMKPTNFVVSLLLYIAIFVCMFWLMRHYVRASNKPVQHSFTKWQLFGRAVFGGSIILAAVVMSKIAGPLYGGVFAAFPAGFVSMLILMHRTHGADFSLSMIRPMYLTGMIVVVGYVTVLRFAYPAFGVWFGTATALIAAAILAYGASKFVLKRSSEQNSL